MRLYRRGWVIVTLGYCALVWLWPWGRSAWGGWFLPALDTATLLVWGVVSHFITKYRSYLDG